MVRRFVTFDGEVKAEEEWALKPTDKCFFCDEYLIHSKSEPCSGWFGAVHDYVTLVSH